MCVDGAEDSDRHVHWLRIDLILPASRQSVSYSDGLAPLSHLDLFRLNMPLAVLQTRAALPLCHMRRSDAS